MAYMYIIYTCCNDKKYRGPEMKKRNCATCSKSFMSASNTSLKRYRLIKGKKHTYYFCSIKCLREYESKQPYRTRTK